MVKRLTRLLISTAFAVTLMTPAGTVFADPGNGNSANAPGQNKTATAPSQVNTNDTNSQSTAASPGDSDHSQGNPGTSGTYSQPQPYSTADQNNTGANDTSSTNQHASTRNGSASLNGNGNGNATGKPCAGCVGKADNKNPKGQFPNGTDRNAGYECDRNHGIGRSNPAHTGCQASSPTGCTSNCGGQGGCTGNNCNPILCQLLSCTPGRGSGGTVILASAVQLTSQPAGGQGAGISLPNTGIPNPVNWWNMLAVVSLIGSAIYWRQIVMDFLKKSRA